MNLKQTILPAIGKKFELLTTNGDRLVIVAYEDGNFELFHIDVNDPDTILSSVTLNNKEAKLIGGIITGITHM